MSVGSVAYKKYIKQWQITEIFCITEVSDWRDFIVTALLDCTVVILYRLTSNIWLPAFLQLFPANALARPRTD